MHDLVTGFTAQKGARGGAVAPAFFTPLDLAPRLYLHADDNAEANGVAVAGWNDRSVNNNDGAQAIAANRPTALAAGPGGHKALRCTFTGSRHMLLPSTLLTGMTEGAAVIVARCAADPPTAQHGGPLGDLGSNVQAEHLPYTDGTIYSDFLSTTRHVCGNPTPSLATWRIFGMRSKANAWRFDIDATNLFNSAANTVGINTGAGDAAPKIGRSGAASWDGDIAAIVLAASYLSEGDYDKLTGWAAHEFGLTANLPAGHPYKNVQP